MERIFTQLLSLLKVTYTPYFVREFLKLYHHTDTTLMVSSFLDQYQIETMAVQFTIDELKEVDYPILAVTQEGINKEHVILTGIDDQQVTVLKPNGKPIRKSLEDFKALWTGVAILIDAENKQVEPNYALNQQMERKVLGFNSFSSGLGICLLVFLGYILFNATTSISLPLLVTKFLGLFLSLELIKKSTGINTGFLKRICQTGQNKDCSQVLRSPAAKILGISLSDIGFLYFSVTLVLLALTTIDYSFYTLLFLGAATTLPFTAFSLIYQWKKVKAWCPLCLMILLLFWVEFGLLTQISFSTMIFENASLLLLSALILSTTTWLFIFFKKQWTKGLKGEDYQQRYHAIKNDSAIIKSVVEHGRQLTDLPLLDRLELDTKGADNELLIVTSPFCQACVGMHKELDQFLQYFQGYISVKVIPILNNNTLNDQVSGYMMNMLASDYQHKIAFINDWYQLARKDKKGFNDWKLDIAHNTNPINGNEIMQWLQSNQINYTPCLILNQRIVHGEFGLQQIKRYLKAKIS